MKLLTQSRQNLAYICAMCDVLGEMELEVVVPWRGSLHWSHFCRVSCSRALKLANSLRNDVDLPKVNLAEKCSPLLGEHFPLNRCQAQPVKSCHNNDHFL